MDQGWWKDWGEATASFISGGIAFLGGHRLVRSYRPEALNEKPDPDCARLRGEFDAFIGATLPALVARLDMLEAEHRASVTVQAKQHADNMAVQNRILTTIERMQPRHDFL